MALSSVLHTSIGGSVTQDTCVFFGRLPSSSSYAVHRKRVVSKALELLDKKDHTSAEADELGALLNSLSF